MDRGGQSVGFIEFNSGANADRAMAEIQVRPRLPPTHSRNSEALRPAPRLKLHRARRATSLTRRTKGSASLAPKPRRAAGLALVRPEVESISRLALSVLACLVGP